MWTLKIRRISSITYKEGPMDEATLNCRSSAETSEEDMVRHVETVNAANIISIYKLETSETNQEVI